MFDGIKILRLTVLLICLFSVAENTTNWTPATSTEGSSKTKATTAEPDNSSGNGHTSASSTSSSSSFTVSETPGIMSKPTEERSREQSTKPAASNSQSTSTEDEKKKKKKTTEKTSYLLVIIVASSNALLTIISMALTLLILLYYKKNLTSVPSTLYFRNGLCDFVSSLGFLLQVPTVIFLQSGNVPVSVPLTSFFVTTVSVKMSIFMNCQLAVVRCINIVNPFYPVRRRYITISSVFYLLIWLGIAVLDVYTYVTEVTLTNKVYLIKSLVLKPEPGFSVTTLTGSNGRMITALSPREIILLGFIIPSVLPAFICFILMIIQIFHLTKQKVRPVSNNTTSSSGQNVSKPQSGSQGEEEKRQKKGSRNERAATTILMVTIIFVLTSIISISLWVLAYRGNLGRSDQMAKLTGSELGATFLSSSTIPLLSSILTSLTLLLRSADMQRELREILLNRI